MCMDGPREMLFHTGLIWRGLAMPRVACQALPQSGSGRGVGGTFQPDGETDLRQWTPLRTRRRLRIVLRINIGAVPQIHRFP